MIIAFLSERSSSAIFRRGMISFIVFGILGYIAGWVIHRVMQPPLAFIDEDEDEDEDNEDRKNGEAMEGL